MRRIACWSLLILFGTVSVLGQGLHLLMHGGGHGECIGCAEVGPSKVAGARCATDCGDCRHAAVAEAGKQPPGNRRPSYTDSSSSHRAHDCLICRYMAQSQVLTSPALHVGGDRPRPRRPILDAGLPVANFIGVYSARAPPAREAILELGHS